MKIRIIYVLLWAIVSIIVLHHLEKTYDIYNIHDLIAIGISVTIGVAGSISTQGIELLIRDIKPKYKRCGVFGWVEQVEHKENKENKERRNTMKLTTGQKTLREMHGDPEQFDDACWKAYVAGSITIKETEKAITQYRKEWDNLG